MSPYLAMTVAISMRFPLRGSVYPAFWNLLMAFYYPVINSCCYSFLATSKAKSDGAHCE